MKILCYTRQPKEDILYANRLAYSMHLAWKSETGEYVPFHHNEGILYAKAVQDADSGVLRAKSLKSPWIFAAGDDTYGIAAVRTDPDGQRDPESEGSILIFRTSDFVHYEEIGLWKVQEKGFVSEVRCAYDAENKTCLVCWRGEDGIWLEGQGDPFDTDGILAGTVRKTQEPRVDKEAFPATGSEQQPALQIEGICPGNAIEIPDAKGTYLVRKLMTPVCEKVTLLPRAVCAGREELLQTRAAATYSDGTVVERRIDWDPDSQGTTGEDGSRLLCGRVHQEHFEAPFAENRADPCCMYWNGKYYYIATNDADDNKTLYIRCADTLEGIMEAREVLILDTVTYPEIGGLLWAPEFHEIGGKLYLFHAATSGEFFREESHVMKLRDGGDPMCREDWSAPQLVVRKDGTPLCEAGKVISLDMTTFEYQGETFAMWSQRQFLPVDQGAWLYCGSGRERALEADQRSGMYRKAGVRLGKQSHVCGGGTVCAGVRRAAYGDVLGCGGGRHVRSRHTKAGDGKRYSESRKLEKRQLPAAVLPECRRAVRNGAQCLSDG